MIVVIEMHPRKNTLAKYISQGTSIVVVVVVVLAIICGS